MSLFASAFETGVTAGPSTSFAASQSGKNKNKRKRPSHGGANAASSDDQLRAAQKNLEKLMKSIDSSDVGRKEIEKVGRESMGLQSKKQKAKEKGATPERKGVTNAQSPLSKKQKKGGEGVKGKAEGRPTKSEEISTPQSKKEKEKKKKVVEIPLPPSPAVKEEDTAGLTSMQKGMKAKLEGARFRWINEQLYTTPSTDAVAMMKKDPKIFADYHMTHRVLTAAWPSPPLPYIIERIDPLPTGTVVADLGCGDAGLARALVPKGKVVLSYDLVSDQGVPGATEEAMKGEGWVVQADFISHVPLPGRPGGGTEPIETGRKRKGKGKEVGSEIVDVVVCCLSLMGTNWVGGIHEACRILRQGGTFHVAEVTSRFVSTEAFVEKVESFGFKLENEESPSTHFTLFNFTKTTPVPMGPVRGQKGWEKRVREGEEILQACVYKKR